LISAEVPFLEPPDGFLDTADFDEAAFVLLNVFPTMSVSQY
jgi:hypothetical protein